MALSTQEQILIEQRVTNESKSTGLAYVLWFFLGAIGVHRFYLGRGGSGFAMLALFVVGLLTAAAGIGFVFLAVLGIWALVDLFLIPGMVRRNQEIIRQRMTSQIVAAGGGSTTDLPDMSRWSQKDKERYLAQREGQTRQ